MVHVMESGFMLVLMVLLILSVSSLPFNGLSASWNSDINLYIHGDLTQIHQYQPI